MAVRAVLDTGRILVALKYLGEVNTTTRLRVGVASAALLTTSLASGLAAAPAQAAPADQNQAPAVTAKAKNFGLVLAKGKGRLRTTFKACHTAADISGNFDLKYKAHVKYSTDHKYPYYTLSIGWGASASGTASANFGLFPGDRTENGHFGTFVDGYYMKVDLKYQGKKKTKTVALASLPVC